MFDEKVLEKIFSDKEVQKIPIGCQATMVKVIEKVLEEMEGENDTELSKSSLL